jgi:hypothetical protein
VNSKGFTFRLSFGLAATLIALALCFRPIPSITSSNDTGRYVSNQSQACALPLTGSSWVTHDSTVVLDPSLIADPTTSVSLRIFDWIMRPACLGGEPRIFLFWAALPLPLAFLLFAGWKRDATLLIAGGLLSSSVGFEFMTNALRQGVGLGFLLAGFACEKRLIRIVAIALAILVHDSNWFFAPLVLVLAYRKGALTKKALLLWSVPLLIMAAFLIFSGLFFNSNELYAALMTYTEAYSETPSVLFLLFMLFPFFFIYLIRKIDPPREPSVEEQTAFWYSTGLLALSLVLFPYITYRFAMEAVAIQAFMATRAPNVSVRAGMTVGGGLIINFVVYAIFSKGLISLFYG